MKYIFCTLFLFIFSQIGKAQKANSLPPGLDKYIQQVLQTFNVPGASVCIVSNGKVLLARGYGTKKRDSVAPVDEQTLFLIASNSKAFTATALAMLVDEGKLKWDDKVIDHLPWFRMSDPYVTLNLTVKDLLVHHSGLPAYAADVLLFPPSFYSRKEILGRLKDIPLVHGFRTTYAYDNILYLAAGEVVAQVSGMSWEDFVSKRIFSKVGMKGSVSRFSEMATKTNFAVAHARYGDSVVAVDRFRQVNIGDAGDPAGGIVSSAADMANWLITQLDSGRTPSNGQLLKPSAASELWRVVRPIPITKVPEAIKPSQTSFWGYALGFRAYNYGKYKIVGHGGALKGFVSQIAMVPDLKIGIAVLTNQQSTGAYWAIINHVLDHYMQNKPFDWIRGYKAVQDSAVAQDKAKNKTPTYAKDSIETMTLPLSRYAGTYYDKIVGKVMIQAESGGLVLRFSNSAHFVADLSYYRYNSFLARFRNMPVESNAFLTFTVNPNGSIEEASLKVANVDGDLDFDDLHLRPINEKIMDTANLHAAISEEFSRHPEGRFAVAMKDLSTGKTFFINEKENFHAASTMKTPVMIETYKQAAAGKFRITDSVLIKNEFKSIVDGSTYSLDSADDSEFDLYHRVGTKLPLFDVLHRMITMSSNLATNIMIDFIGAKNANATMRELGANDIQVLRGVEDDKAFEKGLNNTVTAYDLMLIMEKIATGKAVDKNASEEMIKILMDQHFTDKIAKKLPPGVKVASKSGSIAGISHDSGVVFLPDGRKYVVVLLSAGVASYDEVNNTLANVSRHVYNFIR
ncbi:MAG TPA: serine hydrolase [Chryseolinea sp.]|nr:serine hydrolase [Chryseolinea sp.]